MGVLTVYCVLRTGGAYKAAHVQRLVSQAPDHEWRCLTDTTIPGVVCLPLKHDWPGWWSKIELFRPDISGDLLYVDLDSDIPGDLSRLQASEMTMCSDFLRPQYANSSVMYIPERDKLKVYDAFLRDPKGNMAAYRSWPARWGDQGFISHCLPDARRWPPGLVRSYRKECQQGVPDGTVVVTYHGKPKPWQVTTKIPCATRANMR